MFIFEQLREHAQTKPSSVITSFKGKETTYSDFYQKAQNLAGFFQQKGYQKEDIIALYLFNSDTFLIAYYACQLGGFSVLPINTKLAAPEVEYIMRHSEAKALIYDARLNPILEKISSTVEQFKDILETGEKNTIESVLEDHSIPFRQEHIDKEDTAVIFYTSGTTGKPKGVCLSAENVRAIAEIWAQSLETTSEDRTLIVTPLFHCAASHCFSIPTIVNGGTVIIEEAFILGQTLKAMEMEKVTIFFGVPAIYSTLLNAPNITETDLSHLRLFTYGAAPMPYELVKRLKTYYPNVKVQNLYGQTENSPGATTLKDHYALEKIGSVGEPLPYTKVRVVSEDGEDVPPFAVGEIIVKGPQVMKGYLKNEEATRMTLRDGWLYSGDLGRLDENGLLYIVDRKKDMLIRGGENVYPVEIEEVLYQLDEILEAAVVGIPHPVYGEVPKAFIVLKEGRHLSAEHIQTYCQQNLAKYKAPETIIFVEELPRNASGKVLKHTLRDNAVKA
ncbi:class I adenylate-forming enzyme family protein [Bacillus sp. E214]|uniref:class I adenylate-forming enzyme family protein n=1 Tax=Bacillus sp. E214 TaxID=2587156 RepID=UPI0011E02E24|nr:long-chain-fatty-acid--CoA ligase [Bacillus sp. E214]